MSLSATAADLAERFSVAGIDNAKRTAEELLAHLAHCRPLEIYMSDQALSAEQEAKLLALVQRIEAGEPLQYVIGFVEFRELRIACDRRALIPRPETEELVEAVLRSPVWDKPDEAYRPVVAEVGTGTGCIILSIGREHPEARYIAIDASAEALELARENAASHDWAKGIHWSHSNLLETLSHHSCDLIVANLPYISADDWQQLDCSVRDHEPKTALVGGPEGTELMDQLAEQALTVLRPGGFLYLEIGFDQGEKVVQQLKDLGFSRVEVQRDIYQQHRIILAEMPKA